MNEAEALARGAPEPAVVGNVLLGTAGWADRALVASRLFYPDEAKTPETRLRHYACHFGMVEVDATYYALLPPELAERWAIWTAPEFRFDVKAHPVLTGHPIDLAKLPPDLRDAIARAGVSGSRTYPEKLPAEVRIEMEARFFALVEPLGRAKKLGCVMLQLPPWASATRGGARRLEAIVDRWQTIPFAVEFRHKSWLSPERRERVLDLLRRLGLAYVVVDEPDVPTGGVPPVVEATSPELAIVRFHGRNAAGWRKGATVAERFDYLYSPEELHSWVEPVRRLASRARVVHAVFNNCVRNYAVVNAKGLAVLLGGP